MPPAGFARMAEWQVAANCSLVRLPDKIVALSSITRDPQLDIIAKRWGKPSSGGDPTATVYQRSWDCCGNMMNALYTSLQWSTSGGGVYPVNQWNTTIYLNDGWYLDYQNLQYTYGTVGGPEVDLNGNAGYGWSWGGFYNSYQNWLYAFGDGHYTCNYFYSWQNSAPGWTEQAWCAYGSP